MYFIYYAKHIYIYINSAVFIIIPLRFSQKSTSNTTLFSQQELALLVQSGTVLAFILLLLRK